MPITLLLTSMPVAAGSAHKTLSVPAVLFGIAVVVVVIALSLLYQKRRQGMR